MLSSFTHCHSLSQEATRSNKMSMKRKLNLKTIEDKYMAIQEVEASFKKKSQIAKDFISVVDKEIPFVWNMLDALGACMNAWDAVKSSTIANCFKQCGLSVRFPINLRLYLQKWKMMTLMRKMTCPWLILLQSPV